MANFTSATSSLSDVIKKGQVEKVQWFRKAEQKKNALTHAPVLSNPVFLVPITASETDLGTLLFEGCSSRHPVLYMSCKLTPADKSYVTNEREALAINWENNELKYYLTGCHITLIMDHATLQWMAKTKDTNACITHCLFVCFLSLQDFSFQVHCDPIFETVTWGKPVASAVAAGVADSIRPWSTCQCFCWDWSNTWKSAEC